MRDGYNFAAESVVEGSGSSGGMAEGSGSFSGMTEGSGGSGG